jgi:hypothetical protein
MERTGTAFDFIRIEVPCPQCGKADLQILRKLVGASDTICSFCGGTIDLSSKEWQTLLYEAADNYRKILMIKR